MVGYLNSFPLTVLFGLFLIDNLLIQWAVEGTVAVGGLVDSPRLSAAFSLSYPWDTGLVLLLWGWCGLRLIRGDGRRPAQSAAPLAS
jgi:hypothetical protein